MDSNLNVLDLAQGALREQIDAELQKVLDNIADPNTEATKIRKLTITFSFKPNDSRDLTNVKFQTKPTLAPVNSISTNIILDKDNDGKIVAAEITKGIPGQMEFNEQGQVSENKKVINMKR